MLASVSSVMRHWFWAFTAKRAAKSTQVDDIHVSMEAPEETEPSLILNVVEPWSPAVTFPYYTFSEF